MMTPVDEIKNKLDIVDVIQGYIRLKKAGKDYKALCPFHKEKNASFYVSPSKQIWHCFSCNMGGDIFSFVQKIEGVEFADALRILAQKAGVVLRKQDPQIQSKKSILYEICEQSAIFFQEQLGKNNSVKEYLKNRGLQNQTIKDFRVGYSLDNWEALYNSLKELGFKTDDIIKAGLIIKREKGSGYYDRFRNRIMFPIFDLNGQAVGFSGRIFREEQGAKYINTPETLIYNKSSIIYGLDKAKVDIRKKDHCILVEGQFDVLMTHQAEFKNTIAISGTALTLEHLKILKRYSDNLVFSFDADTGGEGATKRAIGLAQQMEFNIKVIIMPKDKDPADIIKEDAKKWEKLFEKARPVMEFYFENAFSKHPDKLSVDDKRDLAKELLVPVKNVSNSIEQAHWIQVLASKLKVEEKVLLEALRRVKAREIGEEEIFSMPKISQKSRIRELEEYLLSLGLKNKKYFDLIKKDLTDNLITTPELKIFFKNLKGDKKLSSDEKNIKNYLSFKAEHCEIEDKEISNEIESCIKELKSVKLKEAMNKISLDIKEAENKKNTKKLKELTKKFSKLAEKLSDL